MLKITILKKFKPIRAKTVAGIILGLSCFFLCSCEKTHDQTNTIFTENEKKDLFYYTSVTRGDILLSHEIICQYVQSKSENDYFKVKGRIIQAIYVREGDLVKKGQLLASLENDNADENIRNSTYIIEKNTLLIKQSKEQMAVDLKEAKALYNITGKMVSDTNAYNEKVTSVKNSYEEKLEAYANTIELEKLKLDSYKISDEESRIYAGMTGTVSFVKPNLEGTYSNPEDAVISIDNNADCVYVATDMDYKEYFIDEASVQLHVGSGNDEAIHPLKPAKVSSWKDHMIFTLEDENYTPTVGATGTIYAVLDHRDNVLYVDTKAIHKANGDYYVYILDKQGERVMQPITIGLQGDSDTEVISGLKEGEQIILGMNDYDAQD